MVLTYYHFYAFNFAPDPQVYKDGNTAAKSSTFTTLKQSSKQFSITKHSYNMARMNYIVVIMAVVAIVCQAYPESQFYKLRQKRQNNCAANLGSCVIDIANGLGTGTSTSDTFGAINNILTCALDSADCLVPNVGTTCSGVLGLVGTLLAIVIGLIGGIIGTLTGTVSTTCTTLSSIVTALPIELAGLTGLSGLVSGLLNGLPNISSLLGSLGLGGLL
jgi:hypothetical protein